METTILEYLRKKMIQTATERESLSHPDVIAISQQLDRFITMVQRPNLTISSDTHRDNLPITQHLATHDNKDRLRWETDYVDRHTQNAIEEPFLSPSKRQSFV